jgi:hypothetical protein
VPSGVQLFFQAWIADGEASQGVSATPGRRATAP